MKRHLGVVGAGAVACVACGAAYLAGWDGAYRGTVGFLYDESDYLLAAAGSWWHASPFRPPLVWTLLHFVGYPGVVVFNLLCVGVLAGAGYWIGQKRGGLVGGVVCTAAPLAVPELWRWWPRAMPETTALAAVAVAAAALLSRRYWLTGAALGVAALGRPEVLGLAAIIGTAGLWRGQRRRLLAWAGCAVVVAPFTVRNAVAARAVVPICCTGGMNLWAGNLEPTRPSRARLQFVRHNEYAELTQPGLTAIQKDTLCRRWFLSELQRRPGDVAVLWAYKALHFWWGADFSGHEATIDPAMAGLLALAVAGIAAGLARREMRGTAALALLLIVYFWAAGIVVFPMARLRLMILPGVLLGLGLLGDRLCHPAGTGRA